jgi:hypothetical protein
MLTLNDLSTWSCSAFDSDNFEGEEIPTFGASWEFYQQIEPYTSSKGIELRNVALRSSKNFNYEDLGLDLNSHFTLKGDSSMWIFTRCSKFEDNNKDMSLLDLITQSTAIIKISKEDKSLRCFLTMSVYVEDENGNKIFKTFSKRQLISSDSIFI